MAAADGDIDTAVAIYCGYNGGDVSRLDLFLSLLFPLSFFFFSLFLFFFLPLFRAGNLSDLAESEGDKRERADDPETRRARFEGRKRESVCSRGREEKG